MADQNPYPGSPFSNPLSPWPSGGSSPASPPPTDEALITTARGVDSWLTPEFLAAIDRPAPTAGPTPGTPAPVSGAFTAASLAGLTGLLGTSTPGGATPSAPPTAPTSPDSPATGFPGSLAPTTPSGRATTPMTRSEIDSLVARWITPGAGARPATPAAPPAPASLPDPLAPRPETPDTALSAASAFTPPAPAAPTTRWSADNLPSTAVPAVAPPVLPPIGQPPRTPLPPSSWSPTTPALPAFTPPLSDAPSFGDLIPVASPSLNDLLALPERMYTPPRTAPRPPVSVTLPATARPTPAAPTAAVPAPPPAVELPHDTPSARVAPVALPHDTPSAPASPVALPPTVPPAAYVPTVTPPAEPPAPAPLIEDIPVSDAVAPIDYLPPAATEPPREAAPVASATDTGPGEPVDAAPLVPQIVENTPLATETITAETSPAEAEPEIVVPPRLSPRERAAAEREAARAEALAMREEARQRAAEDRAAQIAERVSVRAEPTAEADAPLGRSVLRTILSTILPGAGLLGLKPKRTTVLGAVILVLFLSVIGATTWVLLGKPSVLAGLGARHVAALGVGVGLIALAVLWVAVILGTFLVTHPRPLSTGRRVAGGILVALLSAVIALPLGLASSYAFTWSSALSGIFAGGKSLTRPADPPTGTPLGTDGRLNILLIGGSAANTASPDFRAVTIIVASIDVTTGNTVLLQLPGTMARVPFPADSALAKKYPTGFTDGADPRNPDFTLGAVWSKVPAAQHDLFTGSDYPGGDAMKLAVSGALGIPIDYFVEMGLPTLAPLVDDLGGVTVNVNFPVAQGTTGGNCGLGATLTPGENRHLSGQEALLYATGSCNDKRGDYGMFDRQQCLVAAAVAQADTRTLLPRLPQLAQLASGSIVSDIPSSVLPRVADVLRTAQHGTLSRWIFTHGMNGFNTTNPNYGLVRIQAASAISQSVTPVPDAPPPGLNARPLTDACAYDPQQP